MLKKNVAEYVMNTIYNISIGQTKLIRMHKWQWLEVVESSFHVTLCNFCVNKKIKFTTLCVIIYKQHTGQSKINTMWYLLHSDLT